MRELRSKKKRLVKKRYAQTDGPGAWRRAYLLRLIPKISLELVEATHTSMCQLYAPPGKPLEWLRLAKYAAARHVDTL